MVFKKNEEQQAPPQEHEEHSKNCHMLSEAMQNLLEAQLSHEQYNHNLYKSFANFFGTQGFMLLEEYYNGRAAEEMKHFDWIVEYLNERDAKIAYPAIDAIAEKPNNMAEPFQMTIAKEVETTDLIFKLLEQAKKESDYMTEAWLMSPGKLIQEQTEEESISRTAFDIANGEGDWLTKERAILKAYKD